MKSYAILCAVLAFFLFVSPVLSLDFSKFSKENVKAALPFFKEEAKAVALSAKNEADFLESSHSKEAKKARNVRVLDVASQKVLEVDLIEYLVGCVAGEMPASYHEEALKAQAVAAYTNLLRLQQRNAENEDLNAPDISSDTKKHQAYLDEKTRKEKWGKNFSEYTKKVTRAVEAVAGTYLCYDGKPISATFFSLSNGRTESSNVIWGGDLPYLVSVTCPGDRLAPNLETQVILSVQDVKSALGKEKGVVLSEKPEEWIQNIEYSKQGSGAVEAITVGGKSMNGNQFRTLLNLKSPAFSIELLEDGFHFTTKGHGHFVGMSQNSANILAKQGSDYAEILSHFYPNTTLEKGKVAV